MTLEIKTTSLKPRRHTFANVARRLGADKPASRYDEAMFDLQATDIFHYRPTWEPQYELFDARRTAIKMADFYALRDPRQYYYGTYTIARSRMMESTEKNFSFVEKRSQMASIDPAWARKIQDYLIPLRHFEWGANMNNSQITDVGFGTAITQATMYATMDRLGIAQLISRVGLMMDGGSGESLNEAKLAWLNGPMWQPMRHMVEDSLVVPDWFELFVAQNLVFDAMVYPLVYSEFDSVGQAHGAAPLSMLCDFMADWFDETSRWVNAVVSTAAKESEENRVLLSGWYKSWAERAVAAVTPIAKHVLEGEGEAAVERARLTLENRAKVLSLTV